MTPLPPLAHLGPRICIMGPSNSGKSTLAVAIAEKQSLPVIHLDQLYHQPNTDWQPREHAVFLQLHREAISAERWVIEGLAACPKDWRAQQAISCWISRCLSVYCVISGVAVPPRRVPGRCKAAPITSISPCSGISPG